MDEPGLAQKIKAAAREIGFDAVGICDLRPIENTSLDRWLAAGYGGSMGYMHRQAAKRRQPSRIVPGSSRAVVVLKNYYRSPEGGPQRIGRVARYAWGEDYHHVLDDQLGCLAARLVEIGSTPEHTRWYVDAGPVPERELAQRAGLGWIAKNTMLIHPQLGSFTFIGTVFTDLESAVDEPFGTDRCGSCRNCIEACPTRAFPEPRSLDARRCISYLTIEHRGPFDSEQGAMIGDWLFGCDLCQEVCPWNRKFAPDSVELRFGPRQELRQPDLSLLAREDRRSFERCYRDTSFERSGASGIARNARQVLQNTRNIQ